MPKRRVLLLWGLIGLMVLAGCGKRVNKKNLGPDEYFEYAKHKFDKGKYLDAITEFSVIVLKFSGNPVIDDAQYYLAESHFKQGEYLIAVSEYQKLINDYPQSAYSVLAQFKVGLSYYKLSLRPALDQEFTKKALRSFQNFIEENPEHELRQDAERLHQESREKLARKKMIAATTYRKMGIYDAAVIYYDIIISQFYDTRQVVNAVYWKGESLYKLKKYIEAQNTFTTFVEKYPDHDQAKQAKKRISKLAELIKDRETNAANEFSDSDGRN
ncbi:MAG: outer membrane protein assembly factor BamD [Calditrichaeota bacterium]|nr:outer membrane protein assembly factor BamD [Calditrichota bacterium]